MYFSIIVTVHPVLIHKGGLVICDSGWIFGANLIYSVLCLFLHILLPAASRKSYPSMEEDNSKILFLTTKNCQVS